MLLIFGPRSLLLTARGRLLVFRIFREGVLVIKYFVSGFISLLLISNSFLSTALFFHLYLIANYSPNQIFFITYSQFHLAFH